MTLSITRFQQGDLSQSAGVSIYDSTTNDEVSVSNKATYPSRRGTINNCVLFLSQNSFQQGDLSQSAGECNALFRGQYQRVIGVSNKATYPSRRGKEEGENYSFVMRFVSNKATYPSRRGLTSLPATTFLILCRFQQGDLSQSAGVRLNTGILFHRLTGFQQGDLSQSAGGEHLL